MKPTSIIFLLISLVIILVGWLVCNSAEAKAAEEGIQLFDTVISEDNEAVTEIPFGSDEVYNKIELVADDANVYIYGGFSEPKIRLVNFRDGSFRQTTANRNITIDTTIDITSIIRFWESGFSFRGLRNYFHASDSGANAEKSIYVYLPSDNDINVINITLDKGSVEVSNFDTPIDFNIRLKDGDVKFTDFRTTSQVSAEIDEGSVYFRDAHVGIFEAVLAEGNITAEGFSFGELNINGRTSSVSLDLSAEMGDFTMNLSARHGKITLFGDDAGSDVKQTSPSGAGAMITVNSGDIIITQREAPDTPDGGTEPDDQDGDETGDETGGAADDVGGEQ